MKTPRLPAFLAREHVARRLWRLVRPSRFSLLTAACLLLLVTTATELAAIWLFGRITDRALLAGRIGLFWPLAAGWLALAALGAGAGMVAGVLQARVSTTISYRLREIMLTHLHRMAPSFGAERSAGDLVTRFTGDVEAVDTLVGSGLVAGCTALLSAVIFAVAAFLVRWELALAVCCVGPLHWFMTRRFAGRSGRVARAERAAASAVAAVVEENVTVLALVQTQGAQCHEQRRLRTQASAWLRARLAAARLETAYTQISTFLETLCVLAVLGLGCAEIASGGLTVGGLLSFAGYVAYLYPPLSQLGELAVAVGAATAAGERILDLLDTPPAVTERPDAVALAAVRGRVRLDRVAFEYPGAGRLALRDVSLEASPGQLTIVTGPSGAGKSTLVALLCRLVDPSAGRVLLDGHDLRALTVASARSAVAVVTQDAEIVEGTLWDNLRYGSDDADPDHILAAARAAEVDEFASRLPGGYAAPVGQRGRRLSGGQRRRVAIARALVRRAAVLVLDEPTAGLDERSAWQVLAPVRRLARRHTVVMVTHDLRVASAGDQIVYLADGRVAEHGEHLELLGRGGAYAARYAGPSPLAASPARAALPAAAGDETLVLGPRYQGVGRSPSGRFPLSPRRAATWRTPVADPGGAAPADPRYAPARGASPGQGGRHAVQ
jgi:ATP-binding cassette subfamily B protein